MGRLVTVGGQPVEGGTAGVLQTEDRGRLVVGLADRVVDRPAQERDLECAFDQEEA